MQNSRIRGTKEGKVVTKSEQEEIAETLARLVSVFLTESGIASISVSEAALTNLSYAPVVINKLDGRVSVRLAVEGEADYYGRGGWSQ